MWQIVAEHARWEHEARAGALAHVRLELEPAAELLDDARHEKQAEPHAGASFARGEEGLGRVLEHFGGHPGAVVFDGDREIAVTTNGREPHGAVGGREERVVNETRESFFDVFASIRASLPWMYL
jgi:hypothetical protein